MCFESEMCLFFCQTVCLKGKSITWALFEQPDNFKVFQNGVDIFYLANSSYKRQLGHQISQEVPLGPQSQVRCLSSDFL